MLAAEQLEVERLARNYRLVEDQSEIGRVAAIATRLARATVAPLMFPNLMAYQYIAVARPAAAGPAHRRVPMSIEALLIAPVFHGGEGVYSRTLAEHPPGGVSYSVAGPPHNSAPGARCRLAAEVLLIRVAVP